VAAATAATSAAISWDMLQPAADATWRPEIKGVFESQQLCVVVHK